MKFNSQMVELMFSKVSLKLQINSLNISGKFLPLEQLKPEAKVYLLTCVFDEIKTFLITELYYKSKSITYTFKSHRFFELILLRVKKRLEKNFISLQKLKLSSAEFGWLITYLEIEESEFLDLILYLILCNSCSKGIYIFKGFDSYKLITCFLENLIIKISNIFIYLMFLHLDLQTIVYQDFFYSNSEGFKIQKNDFYWQAYLTSTFLKPKYIYYDLYNIFVLNKHGIVSKLIYIPAVTPKRQYNFSNLQLAVLFYFELIDFFCPKLSRSFLELEQVVKINFSVRSE